MLFLKTNLSVTPRLLGNLGKKLWSRNEAGFANSAFTIRQSATESLPF